MNGDSWTGTEINILDYRLKLMSVNKIPGSLQRYTHSMLDVLFIHRKKSESAHGFVCITETHEDYSIVCEEHCLPKDLSYSHDGLTVVDGTWVPLVVSVGAVGTDATGITKIAKSVIIPLADNDVSVYCLSSYKTDYVLVRICDLDKVCQVLAHDFKITEEKATQSIPVHVKQVLARPSEVSQELRPITQAYTCSNRRFYVTSMDYGAIDHNSLLLIELMFYSCNEPKQFSDDLLNDIAALSTDDATPNPSETKSSRFGDHPEKFFSISIVDHDISLVLDQEFLKKFPPNVLFDTEEVWRMVTIGDMPEGLGFVTSGVVAQMSGPIASAQISEYYISSFNYGHVLVPEESIGEVKELLEQRKNESQKMASVEL